MLFKCQRYERQMTVSMSNPNAKILVNTPGNGKKIVTFLKDVNARNLFQQTEQVVNNDKQSM